MVGGKMSTQTHQRLSVPNTFSNQNKVNGPQTQISSYQRDSVGARRTLNNTQRLSDMNSTSTQKQQYLSTQNADVTQRYSMGLMTSEDQLSQTICPPSHSPNLTSFGLQGILTNIKEGRRDPTKMSFDVISAHSSTNVGRITNLQREREMRKITKSLNRSISRDQLKETSKTLQSMTKKDLEKVNSTNQRIRLSLMNEHRKQSSNQLYSSDQHFNHENKQHEILIEDISSDSDQESSNPFVLQKNKSIVQQSEQNNQQMQGSQNQGSKKLLELEKEWGQIKQEHNEHSLSRENSKDRSHLKYFSKNLQIKGDSRLNLTFKEQKPNSVQNKSRQKSLIPQYDQDEGQYSQESQNYLQDHDINEGDEGSPVLKINPSFKYQLIGDRSPKHEKLRIMDNLSLLKKKQLSQRTSLTRDTDIRSVLNIYKQINLFTPEPQKLQVEPIALAKNIISLNEQQLKVQQKTQQMFFPNKTSMAQPKQQSQIQSQNKSNLLASSSSASQKQVTLKSKNKQFTHLSPQIPRKKYEQDEDAQITQDIEDAQSSIQKQLYTANEIQNQKKNSNFTSRANNTVQKQANNNSDIFTFHRSNYDQSHQGDKLQAMISQIKNKIDMMHQNVNLDQGRLSNMSDQRTLRKLNRKSLIENETQDLIDRTIIDDLDKLKTIDNRKQLQQVQQDEQITEAYYYQQSKNDKMQALQKLNQQIRVSSLTKMGGQPSKLKQPTQIKKQPSSTKQSSTEVSKNPFNLANYHEMVGGVSNGKQTALHSKNSSISQKQSNTKQPNNKYSNSNINTNGITSNANKRNSMQFAKKTAF
eukprot:403352025